MPEGRQHWNNIPKKKKSSTFRYFLLIFVFFSKIFVIKIWKLSHNLFLFSQNFIILAQFCSIRITSHFNCWRYKANDKSSYKPILRQYSRCSKIDCYGFRVSFQSFTLFYICLLTTYWVYDWFFPLKSPEVMMCMTIVLCLYFQLPFKSLIGGISIRIMNIAYTIWLGHIFFCNVFFLLFFLFRMLCVCVWFVVDFVFERFANIIAFGRLNRKKIDSKRNWKWMR